MSARDRYDSLLSWYGGRLSLDSRRLKAQMLAESGADPKARSPVGAEGLFQFMPATWTDVMPGADPFNPESSIEAGAIYMDRLLRAFGNDYRKALAAYNWGLGHVREAVGRLGGTWETALPDETRAYIKRVLSGGGVS